jgi:ketosteroid isomerase-like protein
MYFKNMDEKTITDLTQIQHELIAAWAAGERSTHERVLADDWSVIDPTGNVMTKADVLTTAFADEREIEVAEIDDLNVRDHGDFAIVTGRTHVVGRIAGQDVNMTLRFTDVFTLRSGTWKCLASQGTFVTVSDDK